MPRLSVLLWLAAGISSFAAAQERDSGNISDRREYVDSLLTEYRSLYRDLANHNLPGYVQRNGSIPPGTVSFDVRDAVSVTDDDLYVQVRDIRTGELLYTKIMYWSRLDSGCLGINGHYALHPEIRVGENVHIGFEYYSTDDEDASRVDLSAIMHGFDHVLLEPVEIEGMITIVKSHGIITNEPISREFHPLVLYRPLEEPLTVKDDVFFAFSNVEPVEEYEYTFGRWILSWVNLSVTVQRMEEIVEALFYQGTLGGYHHIVLNRGLYEIDRIISEDSTPVFVYFWFSDYFEDGRMDYYGIERYITDLAISDEFIIMPD